MWRIVLVFIAGLLLAIGVHSAIEVGNDAEKLVQKINQRHQDAQAYTKEDYLGDKHSH